ncbi:MAG: hypothetical protein ABJ205_06410 [Erythrobacter sp.]|uniref:hypothetical protein n=1 Tax=Erythrobacter sp. TaxID=1042 RepID=UPI0032654963
MAWISGEVMRLHPPSTILFLVATSFAVMAMFKHAERPTDSLECRVAHDFITSVVQDGQWFTGDKPIYLMKGHGYDADLGEFLRSDSALPSDRSNPLLPLYFGLLERQDEHLSDVCPGTLDRFPHIFRSPSGFEPVADEHGVFNVIFFGMVVPAVSPDAGLALVSAHVTYAGEDGEGVSVLMMKDETGVWRVAYSDTSWVS